MASETEAKVSFCFCEGCRGRWESSHVKGKTTEIQVKDSNEGSSASPATSTEIGPTV